MLVKGKVAVVLDATRLPVVDEEDEVMVVAEIALVDPVVDDNGGKKYVLSTSSRLPSTIMLSNAKERIALLKCTCKKKKEKEKRKKKGVTKW